MSTKCVELVLKMDVLNSYSSQIQTETLTFNSNSYIYRAHQNRYNMNQSKYIPADSSEILYRYVNDVSEGLESPELVQTGKDTITEQVAPDEKWYLVYRSADSGSGVECYAVPEYNTPFDEGGTNMTINKALLNGGAYVFMALDDNNGVVINSTEHYPNEGTSRSWTVSNSTIVAVAARSSGDYLSIYVGNIDSDNGHISWNTSLWCENSATVIAPHGYRRVSSQSWGSGQSISDALDNIYQIQHDYTLVETSGGQLVYASGIASWDRTDSKLLKIIELPYAPFSLYHIDHHYNVPAYFTFANNKLKLNDLNAKLRNNLSAKSLLNIMYFSDIAGSGTQSRYNRKKNIKYESKLLNSDFRGDKYVYDSYSSPLRYEAMREGVGSIPYNSISFYPSTNIASNLLFEIKYGSEEFGYVYNKLEDYEGMLVSTRNNESPIYTNEYLNYIKTGYNYDKKNKESQDVASGLKVGLSIASLIAGAALAGVTGGSSAVAGAAVAGAIGVTGTAVSAVNQSISAERSLEQKLATLKAKSASVSNADDLSLLNVYNGNKLQWMQYEPTEQVKNALWSMFHLTGYAYNKEGQLKDFLYSRRCFNYVQADLKDGLRVSMIPTEEIKDEIKQKFKEGVTAYHIFFNGTSNIIDWEKEYENFENYICPAKEPIIIG